MKLLLTLFSPLLLLHLGISSSLWAQEKKEPTPEDLKALPISKAGGKVGDLLRQWWKEGTAAGNVGDFYDNRDGAHSDLNTGPYPQLQRIVYTPEQIKVRLHWAAARFVRPGIVFGNSSTSAPPLGGGSNPRMYYVSSTGLDLLHKQYRGNNLYIYPEHRDHDPGHNGPDEGFGDLYPTNTPYLLISQGSSGSDQPFMRAVPFTLAAFRPEVKAKLAEEGLLMPTMQMILRATSKGLKDPKEYLGGKAHPTVFEGSQVDELAMIQMAHDITLDTLPPLAQIQVQKEDKPIPGRDFQDSISHEQLADTPCAIARIWRGKDRQRTLTVSAEKSFDVNKKELKYHWVVLRGDPKRIRIDPKNEGGSVAEITVDYHERLPIAPGSAMASNRVDIGVFVHNGHYFSPPAFLTFYSLDSEARTYDEKGRPLEIGHGMQETRLEVKDWPAFFRFLKEDSGRRKMFPLEKRSKEEKAALAEVERAYLDRLPEREKLQGAVKTLEGQVAEMKKDKTIPPEDVKKREGELQKARQELQKADQELRTLVNQPLKGASLSAAALVKEVLTMTRAERDLEEAIPPDLLAKMDAGRKKKIQAEKERLSGFGVPDKKEAGPGTRYDKALLDRWTGVLLAEGLYPEFLQARVLPHVVDPRLAAPRTWRDVYRYDAKGNYLGWTRWDGAGKKEFNPDGRLVREKDKLGRCSLAEEVVYERDVKGFAPGANAGLRARPTWSLFRYEYDGEADFIGRAGLKTK